MSDNWIQFIPTDPNYQPPLDAAEKAKALLAGFVPRADEVSFAFTDCVEFVHPGGNWSGVKCPSCSANAETWWQDAMDSAYENGFTNLNITTPCCRQTVSLNDLDYVWPAGFSRFLLQAMNPDIKDLAEEQVQQISQALECKLRRIWLHI